MAVYVNEPPKMLRKLHLICIFTDETWQEQTNLLIFGQLAVYFLLKLNKQRGGHSEFGAAAGHLQQTQDETLFVLFFFFKQLILI